MSISELLGQLRDRGIVLACEGDELLVRSMARALDPPLLAALRANKPELRELVRSGGYAAAMAAPEPAPLLELTDAETSRIAAAVPGGADNVQDVYPLAPLQEGILFHHLMAAEGDPYLLPMLFRFDSREGLDRYLGALQAVIDRHDILRTAVRWEGLPEPVQVVWRKAPLQVEEVELDAARGDVAEQLSARFHPRHHRIDLGRAPMMRACLAHDAADGRWLLLLLRHHLISDHTTLEVLQEEIVAHLAGRAASLPRPLPFRGFVAQARNGVSRQEHQAFFTEMLGDVNEPTAPFGVLDARGDGSGFREARRQVEPALAARVRERARALGVSAASVFHVAWGLVLARASGRDDVVFGTLLFGRMDGGEGSDRVMGPFINTLPLRVRLGSVGAEASVRRTHALLAGLLRHEHASLALAQRCSGVEAPAPLFTSLLNYRHGGRKSGSRAPAAAPAPAIGMRIIHAEERANYPLGLSVDDLGDGFRLKAQVTHASLCPARICGLVHRALEGLVDALETAPRRAVGTIDVLPAAERAQVLEEWNRTDAAYPGDACIHQLFEARVERTPGAVAVVFEERHLTYAELNARANRLARHLRALGVGPDARVALAMARSPELVEAELAVLKAGGAYVPLDPGHPDERLREMLDDSTPAALLTTRALEERFTGLTTTRVLALDAASPAWASRPETNPLSEGLTSESLAYVMYTSGSTGRPKGVMIPHRAVTQLVLSNGFVELGAHDRVAFAANPAFDAATLEVWGPLLSGGRVVVVPQSVLLDPPAYAALLRGEEVTTLLITPALFEHCARVIPEALAGVRHVLTGGDRTDPAAYRRVLGEGGPATVYNCYGPTETTTFSIAHPVRGVADGARSLPIGRPKANTRAYVLDGAGEPVPVGAAGELFVAGDGVARGYLGRPGLTAERFVPDPFRGEPGARMYRTGDLCRWTAEGVLDFAGRADHQVKVRGFRIELGEIEARLAEHPGVREAVVLLREDAPGEKRLVAYVAGGGAAGASLRAHLGERLPAYMVPTAYVRLDRMPLTPSGKLDRRALPAPDDDALGRRGYEAPVGETEQALAEIWADVLGVERVGRWDDFFELGGHSLLAVRVISRVRQALRVEVALGELFTRPVLADFARELETAAHSELPPIEPAAREGRLPLSFAQQRLWFLEQLGNLGSTYHVRAPLRLRGALDRAALAHALDAIVARHEALRTTFTQVDDVPEQRIAPADAGFHLAEHDLAGRAEPDGELRRLLDEEAAAPFHLERGPLVRGMLIRLAADDHVLLLAMHHIVSDGWSVGVLFDELSALYAARREGREARLAALPVQYADYAAWQRRWVEGDVLRAQAEYWTRTLAGAPELLELPTDHPRPAQTDHAGARLAVELDEALTDGLQALSRRHGTTLFMTLLAGWAVVLSRLSGHDDVVVGTPTANRGRREIEGLIGFFVNTLALRVDLSGSPTVAELLGRVKERALAAQHHQDIPFEQVVELVDPVRSLSHGPLFQVMFAWQNAPRGSLELPGLALGRVDAPDERGTAKEDLSLALGEANGRITGSVTYATSLFERATVQRWTGYLRRVLEEMAADEARPVERLALMPESERALVVREWSRTGADAAGSCVHELFQAQAARTPGAPAVFCDGEQLTYAELNARANRLAHHLVRHGVGADVRVGVCLDPGVEMVAAVLAVLKAGGGYVPLDPAWPGDRLGYVLADSAPAVLLTQASLADLFAGEETPRIRIDADAAEWAREPETDSARRTVAAHLAYVIYTSGSTGRPKGVRVERGALDATMAAAGRAFGFGPADRAPSLASFAFDIWLFESLLPLLSGGSVRLISRSRVLEVPRLVQDLAACTVLHAVPALMRRIVQEVRAMDGGVLPGLRRAFVGGDAVAPDLLEEMRIAFPAAEIHVLYGPTEAAIICAAHRLGGEPASRQMVGRPLGNAALYVLLPGGDVAPPGAPGELCLGGRSVARDYLGRPALTAERFIPDPFSAVPGARLYRTGDRVRWVEVRAEGRECGSAKVRKSGGDDDSRAADSTLALSHPRTFALEFLGRTDHQVKVRGFRIEPGEIEARLVEQPGVREAVVVVREDTPGDRRLVAYVVGDEAAGADALRAHLGERLPSYMVPAAYVRVSALPLNANGKVDRRALPAPEGDDYARRGYQAPVGDTETALAEIWAEVLGVERVGRNDGFFELGGHSLLAVSLIGRMRRRGLHADVRTLFAAPTLASLAAAVVGECAEVPVPPNRIPPASPVITPEMLPLVTLGQAEVDAIVAAVPGGAANVQDIYPLAPLQEGFLFHHLAAAEGDPYLLAAISSFETREQLDAHLRAFRAVIARHDTLRTAVMWEGLPEPVQVVWRRAPLPVEEVEMDPAVDDVAGELYRRFGPRRHRLDIRRAPLMRGYLARDAGRQRWVFLLLQHHMAGDATTIDVLREEVEAHLNGRADALPAPVPFRNFVAQARLGVGTEEHQAFFREMLGDVHEPTAPFGLLDARGDGTGIGEARLEVDGLLAARLRERARALGVGPATLCHVAWAQVVARTSGRDDVVFGTVLLGRMQGGEGADRVMGPLINTLPVRIRLGNAGAEASVRRTHALLTTLLRHEHAPLALAQRCSGVEAPAPLFTALLNYRHGRKTARPGAPAASGGTQKIYAEERSNYPFTLSVDDLGDGFALTSKVRTPVEAGRVCAMMHTALEGLVEALETAPGRAVGSIEVLPAEERSRVLEEWNRTEAEYPRERCVHQLFEAQAERTPHAVAVVYEGRTLTYAELNARANRLAHHLIGLGVGPDVRVGLYMERGMEMPVGLLAALKAGGCYVPLDPDYPADRLRYMVEDSAPAVLLACGVADDSIHALVRGIAVPVIRLESDAVAWAHQPETNPDVRGLTPDHLVYVIYTSGSTGRPKGVMNHHRCLVNRLAWGARAWTITADDVLLCKTSLSFDGHIREMFMPWSVGGRVAMARPGGQRDPDYMLDVIRAEGVTTMNMNASMLLVLLENPALEQCTGLRQLLVGGEALPGTGLTRLHERLPRTALHITYGPSEAATAMTAMHCGPEQARATVPIGRATPNSRVYLLDAAGNAVPVGVAGELYIGGDSVCRGYLDRPALTAERFVPDPFGAEPGARLYRTGDLGRWLPDGMMEFLGRNDFQVKVRGFRVELGEIEARLREHPQVREAVVMARDAGGENRLIAWYTADETVEVAELRAHLGERLPDYMVPAAFVRMEKFPLTPSAKLDRKALPDPEADAYAAREYEPPADETEEALAEIWAEVLRVERVGRGDDFFALGGHSLSAMRVVSRVRQELGVEVALRELFTRPVLKDFAQEILDAQLAQFDPEALAELFALAREPALAG